MSGQLCRNVCTFSKLCKPAFPCPPYAHAANMACMPSASQHVSAGVAATTLCQLKLLAIVSCHWWGHVPSGCLVFLGAVHRVPALAASSFGSGVALFVGVVILQSIPSWGLKIDLRLTRCAGSPAMGLRQVMLEMGCEALGTCLSWGICRTCSMMCVIGCSCAVSVCDSTCKWDMGLQVFCYPSSVHSHGCESVNVHMWQIGRAGCLLGAPGYVLYPFFSQARGPGIERKHPWIQEIQKDYPTLTPRMGKHGLKMMILVSSAFFMFWGLNPGWRIRRTRGLEGFVLYARLVGSQPWIVNTCLKQYGSLVSAQVVQPHLLNSLLLNVFLVSGCGPIPLRNPLAELNFKPTWARPEQLTLRMRATVRANAPIQTLRLRVNKPFTNLRVRFAQHLFATRSMESGQKSLAPVEGRLNAVLLFLGVPLETCLLSSELIFGKGMRTATFPFSEFGRSLNGPGFSLNCLSCRNPYQTPLSLNASPLLIK